MSRLIHGRRLSQIMKILISTMELIISDSAPPQGELSIHSARTILHREHGGPACPMEPGCLSDAVPPVSNDHHGSAPRGRAEHHHCQIVHLTRNVINGTSAWSAFSNNASGPGRFPDLNDFTPGIEPVLECHLTLRHTKDSGKKLHNAELAAPSTGSAASLIFSASPCNPTASVRFAPG